MNPSPQTRLDCQRIQSLRAGLSPAFVEIMLTVELLEAFERVAGNWYASPAAGLSPWIATDERSAQDAASLLFALLEPASKPFRRRDYVAYTHFFAMPLMHPWNQLLLYRPEVETIELNPIVSSHERDELLSILRKHLTAIG